MTQIKVGLITCSTTTRVLDCPVGGCIKHLHERKGEFERYQGDDAILVGINSCNGCPTVRGVEVILPKVETLVHYGATHIHLCYCMTAVCPFVRKYQKVIEEHYPDIALVMGSHVPGQTNPEFQGQICDQLKERYKTQLP